MRVLLAADVVKASNTGVGCYAVELARALTSLGETELAALASSTPAGGLFAAAAPGMIVDVRRPLTRRRQFWQPPAAWRGFDIVHCPAPLFPTCRELAPARLVVTVHDVIPLALPRCQPLQYYLYFRFAVPRLLRRAARVIVDSRCTLDDVHRYYHVPTERMSVVPLATRFTPLSPDAVVWDKDDYLLAVGGSEPRKNLGRVVAALRRLRAAVPGFATRLVVVGACHHRLTPSLQRELVAAGDVVERRGHVDDDALAQLYRRAKALVYPSLYEGFGTPVLEAMALGCPVIASSATSVPEAAGDAAILVDPREVVGLAAAIQRVTGDPALRRDLIDRGLRRSRGFGWQQVAAATLACYRRALAT